MKTIKWTEEFDVSDATMNHQHQALFTIVNEFSIAVDFESDSATLLGIFDKIVQYTQYHFKDEEELMLRTHYPNFKRHKLIHAQLEDQVRELRIKLAGGITDAGPQIVNFLRNWLTAHILVVDKQYGQYLEAFRIP